MNEREIEEIFKQIPEDWIVDCDGLLFGFKSKESAEAFIGIIKETILTNRNKPHSNSLSVVLLGRKRRKWHT